MTAARPLEADVLGQTFRIDWVAWDGRLYADPRGVATNDRQILGTTEAAFRRIGIRDIGVVGNERETVLHELVHAVLILTGQETDDKDEEPREPVVQAIGIGLLQVLRANPHVVAYLLDDVDR